MNNDNIYILQETTNKPIKVVFDGNPCPLDPLINCSKSKIINEGMNISFVCDELCDKESLLCFLQSIRKEESK